LADLTPEHWARERARWRNTPRERPERILTPGPGQESVWDYPRPPRVEPVTARLRVELAGQVLADTRRGVRVLETSSPPVYYFPPQSVAREWLTPTERRSFCEWKGLARHWSAQIGDRGVEDVAWSYPEPDEGFAVLRDFLAFFPARVDACYVGEERAHPQPGAYYGGWITSAIVGPFKGDPGSEKW
jgi:uncharacterized protein (DUF427 family)